MHDIAASLKIDHLLHRKPETLSGGEQQRTALARALVVKPKLLLMDEPFSALDPVTIQNMRLLLKKVIQRKQTTVIHVTHNIEDVWSLANKVTVLHRGRLLQCDNKETVFQKPTCQQVADFVETSLFEGMVVKQHEHTCQVQLQGFDVLSRDKVNQGTKVKVALRPENEDNVGTKRYGVLIEPVKKTKEMINWSNIVLATGSTVINNTYRSLLRDKPVIF